MNRILITRRGVDRPAAILPPLTGLAAATIWFTTNSPAAFPLPVVLTTAWLLLRFHIPAVGQYSVISKRPPEGRINIRAIIALGCIIGSMATLRFIGLDHEIVFLPGCLPAFLILPDQIRFLDRLEHTREQNLQLTAADSVKRFEECCLQTRSTESTIAS